jgi:hypothetical protein
MNEFPVILRTLLRNRAAALLTIFQVALTLAVLVNVFASSDGYRAAVGQPSRVWRPFPANGSISKAVGRPRVPTPMHSTRIASSATSNCCGEFQECSR